MSDDPDDRSDETRTGLPELTRKLLTLGLGAYFLGEDAVKRAVKETKLPRDLAKSVVSNAAKGKEELFGFVARELSGFLRQMDVQAELSRFASTHKIRVNAEIEFIPRMTGSPPSPAPPEESVAAAAAAAAAAKSAAPPAKPSSGRAPTVSDVGPVITELDVSVETTPEPPPAEGA